MTVGATEIAQGRTDVAGLAVLTLTQELWVVKDRQMMMEALLHDKALLAEVDRFQPSAELAEQIARERTRFIGVHQGDSDDRQARRALTEVARLRFR